MSEIKILIVEDDPFIAEDIRDLLAQVNYSVVGVAHSKAEACNLLRNKTPDIALLDINLGDNTDGIAIAEIINKEYKFPFLYLTSYSTKVILDKVKHTLPMGYIVKPFDEADLFTAIEIAISNFYQFHKTEDLCMEKINNNLATPLTQKEYEILSDLYLGNTNSQIAKKHFVSINTIKTHLQKVFEKLDVRSRSQAIVKIRLFLKS